MNNAIFIKSKGCADLQKIQEAQNKIGELLNDLEICVGIIIFWESSGELRYSLEVDEELLRKCHTGIIESANEIKEAYLHLIEKGTGQAGP